MNGKTRILLTQVSLQQLHFHTEVINNTNWTAMFYDKYNIAFQLNFIGEELINLWVFTKFPFLTTLLFVVCCMYIMNVMLLNCLHQYPVTHIGDNYVMFIYT